MKVEIGAGPEAGSFRSVTIIINETIRRLVGYLDSDGEFCVTGMFCAECCTLSSDELIAIGQAMKEAGL